MKFLFTIYVVLNISILNSQKYFSKHIDIGGTGWQDIVLAMNHINDTIYFTSFNVLDVTDTSFTRAIQTCRMDKIGNLLNCTLDKNHFTVWEYENLLLTKNEEVVVFGTTCCGPDSKLKILKLDKTLKKVESYSIPIPFSNFNVIGNTDIQENEEYFILAGSKSTGIPGKLHYLSFIAYIDKEKMSIINYDTLQFNALNKQYNELFIDNEGNLTAYYLLGRLEGEGNFNSRGFIRYNQDMEVEFIYRDTLEISTGTSNPMSSNGLLLSNGNMVNTQKYKDPNPVFPDHISDYDVVCTNRLGETVWRFNTPGHSPFGRKIITNMSETKDGDILGCGTIRWFKGLKEDDYTQPMPMTKDEYRAPYIIKIDGKTGEEIWEYALIEYNEYGHQGPESLKEFFELSDGSLFGGGNYLLKDSLGQVFTVGDRENSWFIRLPPDGCHDDLGCEFENVITGVDDLIPVNLSPKKEFQLYPNPSTDHLNIKAGQFKGSYEVQLYTLNGQVLATYQDLFSDQTIPIDDLQSGHYLLRFFIKNQNIQNEIFIKN